MDNNSPRLVGTPIRRLGLSRKTVFRSPLITKITEINERGTPLKKNQNVQDQEIEICQTKIHKSSLRKPYQSIGIEKENSEGDNGIKSFKNDDAPENTSGKELELINLINVWKTGFKESLFALQSWLTTHEDMHLTNVQLAKNLGIWKVVRDHFENDSEIMDSDVDTEDKD